MFPSFGIRRFQLAKVGEVQKIDRLSKLHCFSLKHLPPVSQKVVSVHHFSDRETGSPESVCHSTSPRSLGQPATMEWLGHVFFFFYAWMLQVHPLSEF